MQEQQPMSQQSHKGMDSLPAAASKEPSPTVSTRAKVTRGKHSEFAAYIRERTKVRQQNKMQMREQQRREEEMLQVKDQGAQSESDGSRRVEGQTRAECKKMQAENAPSWSEIIEEELEEKMLERSIDGVATLGGVGDWKRTMRCRWMKIES